MNLDEFLYNVQEAQKEQEHIELLKVTRTLLVRYIILRYIFNTDMLFDEMIELFPEMQRRHVAKIILEMANIRLIKKQEKKRKSKYMITTAGVRKLAYYESRYSLYKFWKTPWHDSFNDKYYKAINKILRQDALRYNFPLKQIGTQYTF